MNFRLPYPCGIPNTRKYSRAEVRYRIRDCVGLSDELKEMGYSFIIQLQNIEYIYHHSACGINYIGRTKDPFAKYRDHIIGANSTSGAVIVAAIDIQLVPAMKVIDITEASTGAGVEGYWMTQMECVNYQRNASQLAAFIESPNPHSCVQARINLGHPPSVFKELLAQASPMKH